MFTWRQIQLRIRYGVRSVLRFAQSALANFLFLTTAVALGVTSSWYVIHRGLPFNTERVGGWIIWHYAGRPDEEPYTRARFADSGGLPLSGDRISRLEARFDDEGRRLHSSCVYEISGRVIEARWWTLAVFDSSGSLIANAAQRYGLNSATTAIGADGTFQITLARDARAGNWIPTGSAGRMVVIMEIQEPDTDTEDETVADAEFTPPTITRVSC